MIDIYEEKESMQTNPDILNKYKVTHNDMNQIRNAIINGVYANSSENYITLNDKDGNALDPRIPRYEQTLKFQTFTKSITVPGNGHIAVDLGKIEIPDGYILLGIIPVNAGYGDQFQTTFSVYVGKAFAFVKSYYGTELNSMVECKALFLKNVPNEEVMNS